MGPENKVDMDNCALFLNGEPIAWGKFELPEITAPDEVFEPPKGIKVCQCVEFTLTFKTQRRWRCFYLVLRCGGDGPEHHQGWGEDT